MSRPLKKPLKKKAATSIQWKTTLWKAGEILKNTLSSHPVIVGFGIMTACVITQMATWSPDQKHDHRKEIFNQAGNLYNGVQGTITALAAVPLIAAGIGAAAQVGTAVLTKKPPKTGG